MPKTIKEERLRWILPICNKEIKLVDATKVCPYGKRTCIEGLPLTRSMERQGWSQEQVGGTQPSETPIFIKERIITIRRQTKK